jgi:glycosyltransferase involved in cell wall biosynthesis
MHLFLITLIAFFGTIYAEEKQQTICLNMIVKNEKDVIERCMASALPIIDYWVIVDTGSTDGTQEIIRRFMKEKGVPGELHERPWKNFSHNRNEALQLAQKKADYILFIDADEYLIFDPDFKLPRLDKDFYHIFVSLSGTKFCRTHLINNHLKWEWKGVLHEAVYSNEARSSAVLNKVINFCTTEGARSKDPQKYQKDAATLEEALKEEPNNTRYMFYLAQSYKNCGDNKKALEYYEKRAALGGWNEEVFWSLLEVAIAQENLEMSAETVLASYKKAFQYRPSRIEPLYYMAYYFRRKNDYASAYNVAKIAYTTPPTKDILFVQEWMRQYGIPLELSIAAYWIGKFEECQQLCLQMLKDKDLPTNVRECVERNLQFANQKLIENLAVVPEN